MIFDVIKMITVHYGPAEEREYR